MSKGPGVLRTTFLAPAPHRLVVLTIPKRLRAYCLYRHRLLGEIVRVAARTVTFVSWPLHDTARVTEAFRIAALRLFVRFELFDEDQAAGMLTWPRSGFHAHAEVWIQEDDRAFKMHDLARFRAKWLCRRTLASELEQTDAVVRLSAVSSVPQHDLRIPLQPGQLRPLHRRLPECRAELLQIERQDIRRQRHRVLSPNELPRYKRRIVSQRLRELHIPRTHALGDVSV